MSNNVYEFPPPNHFPENAREGVSKDVDEGFREEFEAWAKKVGYDVERFPVNPDEYLFSDTQWAWIGWCGARMEASGQESEEPLSKKEYEQAIEHVIAAVRKNALELGRREGLAEAERKRDLFALSPAVGIGGNLREAMTRARAAAKADSEQPATWFNIINGHLETEGRKLDRYQTLCGLAAECASAFGLPKLWHEVLKKAAEGEPFELGNLRETTTKEHGK